MCHFMRLNIVLGVWTSSCDRKKPTCSSQQLRNAMCCEHECFEHLKSNFQHGCAPIFSSGHFRDCIQKSHVTSESILKNLTKGYQEVSDLKHGSWQVFLFYIFKLSTSNLSKSSKLKSLFSGPRKDFILSDVWNENIDLTYFFFFSLFVFLNPTCYKNWFCIFFQGEIFTNATERIYRWVKRLQSPNKQLKCTTSLIKHKFSIAVL